MKGTWLQILKMLALLVCLIWLPAVASAAGVPVAVFPLQELGEGRNDANLPFTRILIERLVESDNNIVGLDTVITFMANNRIRTVGFLETYHISRVQSDLGAAFVLLGTLSERKERPEPSVGLTLNLVRTSDGRTIWTYVGSMSTGEERRVLGIGEPQSTIDLQFLLLDEIVAQWPLQSINEAQQAGAFNIDTAVLQPRQVRPGDEIHTKVRLRDIWTGAQAPRVFFWADDQLYPAKVSADGSTYEAVWVAGEENGRFPVTLLLEWPHYGRIETALLGNYVIDGTPPLFEFELHGTKLLDGMPVFSSKLQIIPRMLVRKPLSHWRLSFNYEDGPIGVMEGSGNLPESFIWEGRGSQGDGIYEVVIEVWDEAGNSAKASKEVAMNRSLPEIDLALDRADERIVVDLAGHDGKVPLAFWRIDMWTKEGKMLTKAEGRELPVKIDIDLPDSDQDQEIKGFVFLEDILGRKTRRKVEDLLPKIIDKSKVKEQKPTGISESWVEEF